MNTRAPEVTQKMLTAEKAFHALQTLGYKILLKFYECTLGEIDFVAKHNGELVFIGINKIPSVKVAEYYIKRYGIKDVPYKLESFQVA